MEQLLLAERNSTLFGSASSEQSPFLPIVNTEETGQNFGKPSTIQMTSNCNVSSFYFNSYHIPLSSLTTNFKGLAIEISFVGSNF